MAISAVAWAGIGGVLTSTRLPPLPEHERPLASETFESSSGILSIVDRLGPGDTLSGVLARNGFSGAEIFEMARALSAVMDVRLLKIGDEIEIRYGAGKEVAALAVHHDRIKRIQLFPGNAGWQSEATSIDLERKTIALTGVLEDNLFLSVSRLGEGAALTIAFANVFAWDFDFYTQSRRGDQFSLVVQKLYREGEFVGYGDLLAARYVSYLSGERVYSAFLYEDPSGRRDYYDLDGNSLRKAFLRAPLEFERISSGFSYNRLHPIHKRRMPHLGVDYAARKGTPVYSIGAGVVADRGWRGGGGNQVTIDHVMGYTSKYLHLSRFARGLSPGKRVEQKQIIGYVGDTGTATAPHLDFRLLRHGKPVNPLTQIFPPGPPVSAEHRMDYEATVAALTRQLDQKARPVAVADN